MKRSKRRRRHRRDREDYHNRRRPSGLYRDPANGMVMGVCAGVADYLGIRRGPTRVLTVLAMLFTGVWPILIGYFIMGFVLEERPEDLYEDEQEEEFWREVRVRPDYTMVDLKRRFRDIEKRTQDMEAYVTSKRFRLERELRDLES